MSPVKNMGFVFFHGIGGIGMSALAHYYLSKGYRVFGYDRTPGITTAMLESKGISIIYTDDISELPEAFKSHPVDDVLVVVTPAIPSDSSLLTFFNSRGYTLLKRSESLGQICANRFTVTVAGTHGKTTTSTLLAHILITAGYHTTAFLGGLSNNLNANYALADLNTASGDPSVLFPYVAEADEFDRSFHKLHPHAGIITSTDPDHLDIYGSALAFAESFQKYVDGHQPNAYIVYNKSLEGQFNLKGYRSFSYSVTGQSDFYAEVIEEKGYGQRFMLRGPLADQHEFFLSMPGRHNLENAVAACALSLLLGVNPELLAKALASFKGIRRRFEKVTEARNLVYIDDYAHHPTELNACLMSLRRCYPEQHLTVIFQPHLFSRTKDFMSGFADALSEADELILMEIYPAREKPIPGVTSEVLLEKTKARIKSLKKADEIIRAAKEFKEGVVVTLGAGDIDRLIEPLKEVIEKQR